MQSSLAIHHCRRPYQAVAAVPSDRSCQNLIGAPLEARRTLALGKDLLNISPVPRNESVPVLEPPTSSLGSLSYSVRALVGFPGRGKPGTVCASTASPTKRGWSRGGVTGGVCATRKRNAIHFRAVLAARGCGGGVCVQRASAMQSIFVPPSRPRGCGGGV